MNSSLLAALLASGATSTALPSAWREALIAAGAADGTLQTFLTQEGYTGSVGDGFGQYLRSKGYVGTLSDMLAAASAAQDLFAQPTHPLASLFDVAGFLYDGAYASGGVDFGVDDATECEASGDPCGFVRDVSGTDWHLEQAVSANRLTYRVDAGGIKSFINGPTVNGGSARWAEVTGATALPAEYTDIAIFKLMKLNDPEGDAFWDVSNFTGTGATFDSGNYRCGYGANATTHPNYGQYAYLRSAGAGGSMYGVSNPLPTLNGTGFVLLANSNSWGVSIKRGQQTPSTLTDGGAAANFVHPQDAYPRVRIGYDVDYKIINVEYAFRMRIHRLLTTEEIATVLAYLNGDSGLSAWTGGAA